MLKIVKTPTIKQFSYYFFTITKWRKKKCPLYFFFFGDVIIHKTGTMPATGQGPTATPWGRGSVGTGTVRGTRESLRGREGGNNSELGSKIKYLSGGGTWDRHWK